MASKVQTLALLNLFAAIISCLSCTKIVPQPQNATICGVAGSTTQNLTILTSFETRSFSVCQEKLYRVYYQSQGFSWNSETLLCTTFSSPLSNRGFIPSTTSKTIYADQTCYSCKLQCPERDEINVLVNSNFDTGYIRPWFPASTDIEGLVLAPGYRSNHSVKFYGDFPGVSQELMICPGAFYYITFAYRSRYIDGQNQTLTVSTTYWSYDVEMVSGNPWMVDSDYISTVDMGSISVSFVEELFDRHTDDSVFLDSITLFPYTAPLATVPNAKEVILNPGFESGALAPWQVKRDTTKPALLVGPGIDSKYQLQITWGPKDFPTLVQNITLVKDRHYLLSFDYVVRNATTWQLLIGFADPLYGFSAGTDSFLTNGANSYAQPIVAHANLVQLELSFLPYQCFESVCHTYVIDVDNFSLKELASPADG